MTNPTDLVKALEHLGYNSGWVIRGDKYADIEWIEPPEVIPSEAALAAAANEVKKLEAAAEAAAVKNREEAIAHAKSLGFTDAMIAVIYPNLGAPNE